MGFWGFLGVAATRPRCHEGKLTNIVFAATWPRCHMATTLKLRNIHSQNYLLELFVLIKGHNAIHWNRPNQG